MQGRDIDWNQAWKEQALANRRSHPGTECASTWNGRAEAEQYWRNACADRGGRVRLVLESLDVGPEARVLDIGAGPGSIVVPLAPRVAHITAVEPAQGMASVLQDNLAEYRLGNVAIVRKKWEEVDPDRDLTPPYDLVLAAFSMGMVDLHAALVKMMAVSRRRVAIYWFLGRPTWTEHRFNLWPRLHGRPAEPWPEAGVIYNVLYAMGIYANVQVMRYEYHDEVDSWEQLIASQRNGLGITTAAQQETVRAYLTEHVGHCEGKLVLSGQATFAKIWFDVGEETRAAVARRQEVAATSG